MRNDNSTEWSELRCGVVHFRLDKVSHTVIVYYGYARSRITIQYLTKLSTIISHHNFYELLENTSQN